MKVGVVPENILERVALASGQVPTPFIDTWATFMVARSIMAATELGFFEALAVGPLTAQEVAEKCGTDPEATAKLLDMMVASDYLKFNGDKYELSPITRKWLLKKSPNSIYDVVLFRYLNWEWMAHLEDFVRTGRPFDMHSRMSEDDWGVYQRAMRQIAGAVPMAVNEIVRSSPIPDGASKMLDIGGSHGYYSVAFCRKYRGLSSVVLDLPQAVKHAAPLLAREGMGDRVTHRVGDALSDDLGDGEYDLILMSELVHLFAEAQNRDLVKRAARALKPGGHLVIIDMIRRRSPKEGGQGVALIDLFFAFTSESGLWSFEEMAGWQRDAGLEPLKPVRFRALPGIGSQIARKVPIGQGGTTG